MRSNKIYFTRLLVILLIGSMARPVFAQAVKGGDVSITGTILGLSQNFETMTFFEKNIGLTNSTVVSYEDGRKVRVQDLKPGLLVTVEAANTSKGLLAKKIVIQTLRRE